MTTPAFRLRLAALLAMAWLALPSAPRPSPRIRRRLPAPASRC